MHLWDLVTIDVITKWCIVIWVIFADLYAKPVELVKKVFGDFSLPMEILGKDFVECLHWRKGALIYMYCSTLQEQKERIQADLTHYLQVDIKSIVSTFKILSCMSLHDIIVCDMV